MGTSRVLVEAGIVACLVLALPSVQTAPASGVPSALAEIRFSFKLDARLTRGMYMGDRWVSPPTFTSVHTGETATVDVRAEGVAANGTSLQVSPEWKTQDPAMVTVSPVRGSRVKITVHREGASAVEVLAGGIAAEVLVRATRQGEALRVEVTRTAPPRPIR